MSIRKLKTLQKLIPETEKVVRKKIDVLNINKCAWNKMEEIMKVSENKVGFLFSASPGGCNGFNYDLSLMDKETYNEIKNENRIFNFMRHKRIKVYVDPLSEFYLLGTTIDYIREDFSKNIYESKFIFTPEKNKATTCGCGVSFSPKVL
jgi:iron-sulfur cluster assembly accessory protein